MPVEEEMQEVKKEITKTHNLIIKTDNLVKNLSSEIRQIQKKQEKYERKYIFNSVVAYVIFVIVIFGGLYVAFEAKVGVVRREKEVLEEKLAATEAERDDMKKKLSIRAQQERVTERFLRLKRQNQDFDALKEADRLDAKTLSPLLSELVKKEADDLRSRMASTALQEGKALLQKGHLMRALREFDRALKVRPPGRMLAQVHYYRGNALQKLNKIAKAAEAFLAAAEADPDAPFADTALYSAGTCLETSGDVPRALSIYERFLNDYGTSRHSSQVRWRVTKLTRSGPAPVVIPEPGTEVPKPKPKPGEEPEGKPKKRPKPAPKPPGGGSEDSPAD
jgi:tetratricopeptide (TPR) repeat protein